MKRALLAFALAVAACSSSSDQEIALRLSKPSATVLAGGAVDVVATVTTLVAASGTVTLSLAGAPAGVTFAPATLALEGRGAVGTLALATRVDTPAGTYPLTFSAALGDATASATFSLVITDSRGGLVVSVLGPSGVELTPAVRVVNGAGATVATVSKVGDQTVPDLLSGNYTVVADPVMAGGRTYSPTVIGSPVTVHAGETARTSVNYGALVGALNVVVSAPAGVVPAVIVRGAGQTVLETIGATGVSSIADLPPGSYTIEAAPVSLNGFSYTPTVDGSPVTVSAGVIASVTVAYGGAGTGALSVTVTAPAGVAPQVTIRNSAGGVVRALDSAGTVLIADLAPGSYTVTAATASAGGDTFVPTVTGSPADVVAGQIAHAGVAYQAGSTGSLRVVIAAPDGVTPAVAVLGAGGVVLRTLEQRGATTLDGLAPGMYTVVGHDVSAEGYRHVATVTGSPVIVSAGQTALAGASYHPVSGALVVSVLAKPGVVPSVTVTDPDGNVTGILTSAGTFVFDDLPPGTYKVAAATVAGSDAPVVDGGTPAVIAGRTARAAVSYGASGGSLAVEVTAPAGVVPSVLVKTDGGQILVSIDAPGTTTVGDLPAGSYLVTAHAVTAADHDFQPAVTGSPATVKDGQMATASVRYSATSGAIALVVRGPAGVNPPLTLVGPGAAETPIPGVDQIISGLAPGGYQLRAVPFTGPDGYGYAVAVTGSPLQLEAGKTATITVEVTAVTGTLTVDVALAAGVAPAVTVKASGGAVVATIDSAGPHALTGLAAGRYTIAAADVVAADLTFGAQVGGSPAFVVAGQTSAASVVYTARTGVLVVSVNAPATVTPAVTVKDPTGAVIKTLGAAGSVAIGNLAPGTYAVLAAEVRGSDGFTYKPNVGGTAVVVAGQTARATATYGASTGTLRVTVEAPFGITPRVVVKDEGGLTIQSIHATGTIAVGDLAPGSYQVTAGGLHVGPYGYAAVVTGTPAVIQLGADAEASVVYRAVTGALAIPVTAPAAITPAVTLTDPDGMPVTIPPGGLCGDLTPGNYVLTAAPVLDDAGYQYTATVGGLPATVEAGVTRSLPVAYAVATGTLELAVTAPGGITPHVTATAPDEQVVATVTAAGTSSTPLLAPGSYLVAADDVKSGGYTYRATVTTSPAALVAGATTHVAAAYAAVTGAISLGIVVPPGSGVTPDVSVKNPDGSLLRHVTAAGTTVLDDLAPGSYAVTVASVGAGGARYDATMTGAPAQVSAGATAAPTVTYVKGPPLVVDKPSLSLLEDDPEQTLVFSEAGYAGSLSELDTCGGIAGVTNPSAGHYGVTPLAAGSCTITVTDDFGQSAGVAVAVTFVRIHVQ